MAGGKPRLFTILAALLLLLLLLVALQCSRSTTGPSSNLLVNGDAEAGPGSQDGTTVMKAQGWAVTGLFNVVQYGAGEYPGAACPGPANRGRNFFAGGPNGGVSTASQVVDVSGYARQIDAGTMRCDLSGWLGGYASQDDHADLSAEFQDGASSKLGAAAIGPVLASGRHQATGFVLRATSAAVPAGTRKIAVTLTMTRTEGTSNDGYADSLALTLVNAPPK